MDNLPRLNGEDHINFDNGHLSWVDATFQALLSAKTLLQMADLLGRQAEIRDLGEEIEHLKAYCNAFLWDEQKHFYFDRFANGGLSTVKHIGAYWALLAECIPADRLPSFVAHLENPAEFKRVHCIPALSADDPAYSGTGDYWCGGIWAPTNYMVLKGLEANGQDDLAHEIAKNHLENVVKVYESDDIRWAGAEQFRQFFHMTELAYDDKHTLWENYSPDVIKPGSHSKPGYVGWSGIPPIAVLLEDIIGLSQNASTNQLTWHVRLTEEHGVHRYPYGATGILDVKCKSRNSSFDRPSIEIHSNIPLNVDLIWEGGTDTIKIDKEL